MFAKALALMLLLVMLPVMALAADFAVVHGGRLNLREYARGRVFPAGFPCARWTANRAICPATT